MAVDERRVVQVFAPAGDAGEGVKGSGYVLRDGLVLTARHVVQNATRPCEVRSLASTDWTVASRVWLGEDCDAALLAVDLDHAGGRGEPPPTLGRLVTGAKAECEAIGFPWAQLTQGEHGPRRRTERIFADVDALSGLAPGEAPSVVAVNVRGPVPVSLDDESPWAGMSGSVLVTGRLVVGVVILDPPRFGPDRLGAVLITTLAEDPVLGPLLAGGERRPVLRAVEAAGVLQPGYQPQRPPVAEERAAPSFSRLLRVDAAVVPFRGRERELAQLEGWRDRPGGVAIAVLTGAGGSGKTRLAAELCARTERADAVAGFLLPAVARERVRALAGRVPVLIVIDEANSRPADVTGAIVGLTEAGAATPLRVLLIAREQGGWWSQLRAALIDNQDALDALDQTLPVEAATIEQSIGGRQAAFAEAVAAFTAARGEPAGPVPQPDLSGAMFSSVFFIHLAALSAVMGAAPRLTGSILREDLINFALEREARYWRATANTHRVQVDDVALGRAVALASLTIAADEDQAARMLALVPDFHDAPAQIRPTARWLKTLYPPAAAQSGSSDTAWFRPLTPDPLAETLITRVIAQIPTLLVRLLASATPEQARPVLSTLAQTAHTHSAVVQPLHAALTQSDDPTLPTIIEATVPQQTTALRELAVLATDRMIEHIATEPHGLDRDAQTARLLNNQAVRLGDLGRREDALTAIDEAVTTYRDLAAARPDAFLPDLASSLNNQSNTLSNLGRREDALTAIDEAVTTYRDLAAARPDAFLPDLASSLNNQSNTLSNLGRREDALTAINEAVTTYRDLAAARPDAFLPDLAGSLNNQSAMLSGLGRREDALTAINEAVTTYRDLAAARPDAFLPDLASSLNNQSNTLSNLGRREDALTAINEAVTIRRDLAAARPDAFLPDLASSLNNQSNTLSGLGRREDALTAIDEAVTIRRDLAAARPDAFLPDLAGSLNNQSAMLSGLGRREDALTAINEAVTTYRDLAAARPDAFLPDLASSLNNQSNTLSNLGRREDALTAINEAVTIRRDLAAARPDAFLPDLASSLNNQSNTLSDLGRREDALTAIDEAVTIRRDLAAARPDAFLPDLAMSLNNRSNRLGDLGRREDALTAIDEAVRVILPLLERAYYVLPDAGLRLAQSYVTRCKEAKREPEAQVVQRLAAVLAAAGMIAE